MTQKRPPKPDQRESGLVQRMRKAVRELPMQRPHVLLACSGGKDSVALAWLFAELRRLEQLTFSIAHIHHGQHDRADLAAEAVQGIGVTLDAAVTMHRLKQDDIEAHRGVGLEESMRRERYLALASIAEKHKADCIALAHHQTDQAESILLHLMRGAGVDGLAGMRTWDYRSVPWWDQTSPGNEIGFWRPLIGETVDDVAIVAEHSGLPIVEDPTNIDTAWRRNAIRHQVLPVLEHIAEGSTAAIARSAEVIAGDADLLAELTDEAFSRSQLGDGLSGAVLQELPDALQVRVVRRWVNTREPNLELTSDRARAIVDLAKQNRGGAVIEIGSGRRVALRNGKVEFD